MLIYAQEILISNHSNLALLAFDVGGIHNWPLNAFMQVNIPARWLVNGSGSQNRLANGAGV